MDALDIICIVILIIIIILFSAVQLVWYVQRKLSGVSVKLPTIKIEKPCILVQISSDLNNRIVVSARNPKDPNDYYDVKYY